MSQIPAMSFGTNPVTFADSRANAGTGHSWRSGRPYETRAGSLRIAGYESHRHPERRDFVIHGLTSRAGCESPVATAPALGRATYLLGYSDLSAFTRAFRRWTGRTPSGVALGASVHGQPSAPPALH